LKAKNNVYSSIEALKDTFFVMRFPFPTLKFACLKIVTFENKRGKQRSKYHVLL